MSLQLTYVRINPQNLHRALQIQNLIWPQNPVDRDYIAKADAVDDANANWLVYYRSAQDPLGELIGLTGLYYYDPDEKGYDDGESIWMDWFGVLPTYRGKGFGHQILCDTIAYARRLDRYKYFRLDTSDFPDRTSTKLYDQIMELREDYTAETYQTGHHGLVYSFSLGSFPVKPWGNRLLELGRYGAIEKVVL